MSVVTDYDRIRYRLREQMNEIVKDARVLLDEDTWGYEDMRDDYAIEVYLKIKAARDSI